MNITFSLIMAVILLTGVLLTLKKLNMNFFHFFAGSLGLFTILMIFFLGPLEHILGIFITNILDVIGNFTNLYEVFTENSILIIDASNGIVSMLINYECSGVIELMVFSSLVIFFPFVSNRRKVVSFIFGNAYIIITNIIRILFIVAVVKIFGVESYRLAHVIFARILFFGFMVILYYWVFTKNQLRNQKVGDIK